MRTSRMAVAALALLLSSLAPGARADEREDQLRQHFSSGMKSVRAGQYAVAAEAFERFLELNPEPDLVLSLENEAGDMALQQMLLAKGDGLQEIARRILRKSEESRRRVAADPAMIQSLVAEVDRVREKDDAQNFESYIDAKQRLVQIGAPAASALIESLVDEQHHKVRARVQVTLVEMRREAVLPLVAALASPRPFMRQCVCFVLGQIADPRATAALKARFDDAKESAEVRDAAGDALRKITKGDPATLPPAAACYYRLAESYHDAAPDIARSPVEQDHMVWYFDTQRSLVLGRPVPGYAYNDHLAEQACYAALRVDSHYAPVLPLLICVTLAQMREVDRALALETQRLVGGEGDAARVDALKSRRDALAKGKALALSGGRGPLYAALQRSMDRGEIPVAQACLETLAEVEDASWLPNDARVPALTEAWGREHYLPLR